MGSFNTTCVVSKSPIREGDKVRLFFLISKTFYSQFYESKKDSIFAREGCYPWDNFKVIGGISIPAVYADYNNYEFEDTIFSDFILDIIKKKYQENIPEEGVDYNPYHDHMSVKVEDLDWEKVLDMIHSGRLFTKGQGGNNPFITKMAVHESVYEMMKKESFEVFVHDDTSDGYHYEAYTFEHALQKELAKNAQTPQTDEYDKLYKTYLDVLCSSHDDVNDIPEETLVKYKDAAETLAKMELDSPRDDDSWRHEYSENKTNPVKAIKIFAKNNALEYNVEEVITAEVEAVFFNDVMQRYNLMYAPHMTSGQEHDLEADAMFHNKIASALSTISNKWEDDEHVVTAKHSKIWQTANMSDFVILIQDSYEDFDDEEYIAHIAKFQQFREDHEHIDVKEFGPEQFADPELKFITDLIYNKTINLELNIHK